MTPRRNEAGFRIAAEFLPPFHSTRSTSGAIPVGYCALRYTPTTTFETFPFPVGARFIAPDTEPQTPSNSPLSGGEQCGDSSPDKGSPGGVIATAAQTLDKLRNNWLNPPQWTDWQRTTEEEKAGYPMRPVAKLA